MNCREAQSLLADHLTGQLASGPAHALDEHLAECPACRREFAAMTDALEALADTVPPVAPPEDLKAGILARVHAPATIPFGAGQDSGHPQEGDTSQGPNRLRRGYWRWFNVAALLAGVLLGAAATRLWWSQGSGESAADAAAMAIADYRLNMAIEAGKRNLGGAPWHVASFKEPNNPDRSGFFIWDVVSRELHFYAFGLPEAPVGMRYRLWLVTDADEWIRVGELSSQRGVGALLAAAPVEWSRARTGAVTLDPVGDAGGNSAARGETMLTSDLTRPPEGPQPQQQPR